MAGDHRLRFRRLWTADGPEPFDRRVSDHCSELLRRWDRCLFGLTLRSCKISNSRLLFHSSAGDSWIFGASDLDLNGNVDVSLDEQKDNSTTNSDHPIGTFAVSGRSK
jgi:hypothetical protein